jgi:alkanesulfonate monooxygenase SsuD/methylene tetrahydromethanopterin reductase-like flavin-dependent oxidoreductase (luciferase family)
MQLVTTIALPVVRGPAAVAKAAAARDVLSGGRFVLGVGPGSSARDYESAGVRFDERWPRLEESIRVLRTHLRDGAPIVDGRFYATPTRFEPSPVREGGVPIWIGSWGSDAGLRRVARLGNGWIASAYNTTPARLGEARSMLGDALAREGRSLAGFPCALTTMWTYVTDDDRTRRAHLQALERMLNRPGASLERQLLVGPAEVCAAVVREYAEAGVDRLFVWPLADCETQLDRFMTEVVPLV